MQDILNIIAANRDAISLFVDQQVKRDAQGRVLLYTDEPG